MIADRLTQGRLSIRSLVELREVLTDENHAGVLTRAEGMSQEEAQLLAVEYKPKPVPRDVIRALPMPPGPLVASAVASAETSTQLLAPEVVKPLVASAAVPAVSAVSAETRSPPEPTEVVKPLTPDLRRLNVTVTAEFIAELEQVRVALSHKYPDGNFEQVVREAFKLILERDRKRKALTDRPRAPTHQPRASTDRPRASTQISGANDRYVPAAIKRAVWQRDQARCTWPMGDGKVCGSTHRLEFDHDLEVALGGKPTIGNIRLLCRNHNLMKAEQHLGRAFMAKFRRSAPPNRSAARARSAAEGPLEPTGEENGRHSGNQHRSAPE